MKNLLALVILFPLIGKAQPKPLDSFFSQLRAGKYPSIPAEASKPENATIYLNALTDYYKDTTVIIRSKAAAVTRVIGAKSTVSSVRIKAVQQLIRATRDKDSGNTGAALTYLTEFKKSDFSKTNKDSLRALLSGNIAHAQILMKLVGYLEMQEVSNDLFAISQDPKSGRKERWTAMLALARMDDENAIIDVMNRVKRLPIGDDVVYEIFPDLIYTRRREAINYLIEALNSDAKNCESADAEREAKIPCAYRVMEMLAPVIEGYPLKLSASGDVETKDYPAALTIVREWFKVHSDYKILKDRF